MKTLAKTTLVAGIIALSFMNIQAQSKKETLAVINIDSRDLSIDPVVMGNMTRIELEKMDVYDVKDKYDVQYFMEQNKISMTNCYGKVCLTEVGILLKSDKMFTGSVERMGKTIVVTYRLLNVKTSAIEKTYVHEFLYLPEEIQNMVKLAVADMFGQTFDANLMTKLSKPFAFDNTNNNPTIERLRLDGPRMGFTTYTGDVRNRMMESKKTGGFDVFPVMFQFGYQFEKQYLNEGKVQALFEFIPMITGLDQGYFIPSATLLHGVRSNVNGWEFAFGPTFNLLPIASGYYDQNGDWQLESEWNKEQNNKGQNNPFEIVNRLDSRGAYRIHSSFVLAAGRTFKSGKLNMPVNFFVIPGRDGWKVGISVGFNAKNKY